MSYRYLLWFLAIFSRLLNSVEPSLFSESCPTSLTLVCCDYSGNARICSITVTCEGPDKVWKCCREKKPSIWVDCEDPYSDIYEDGQYPADDGSYLPPPEDESNWNWFKPVPFGIPGDSGPVWNIFRQLITKDDTTPLDVKASAPYIPSHPDTSQILEPPA